MFNRIAHTDFTRARRKAFFHKIRSWFSGKSDTLLPFDQVREAIPLQGQRYLGLHPIPINQIAGSMGRYHEFNRAFLPLQDYTKQRWINIGQAHYEDVTLPPIDVYKIGEVYFVRDGNHRVSVGRELGKEFIDAYITEISIPVSLSLETDLSDLETKRESVAFLQKTGLLAAFPDAEVEVSLQGEVDRLFEHIETHRYYLSLGMEEEPTYETAVRSWYTRVYTPLVDEIVRQGLDQRFSSLTKTDLYLLVSEYQWLLREAYEDEAGLKTAQKAFTSTLEQISPDALAPGKRVSETLKNAPWLDSFILRQERNAFIEQTGLDLNATIPGAYTRLLQHIHDHRWFLGIDRNSDIDWPDAVNSWYENIFLSISVLIEEMDVLSYFPGRTDTDLYLWIMEHRSELSTVLSWDVPAEIAARDLIDQEADERGSSEAQPKSTQAGANTGLYRNILVPISDQPEDLDALDQALIIAERNNGQLYGLHVISSQDEESTEHHTELSEIFANRCAERGVKGKIAFETGSVSKRIAERANWMDLIVLSLNFPPGTNVLARFSSGFRFVLRRSGKPVLAVPQKATAMQNILLAYDGSQLADEALYIASCLVSFWENTKLTVLTAGEKKTQSAKILARAQSFLDSHLINATYVRTAGPASEAILDVARSNEIDLILMGGYGGLPLFEIAVGSTLDGVLQNCNIPVLIRT